MKTALMLLVLAGFSAIAQPRLAWVVRHTYLNYETIHQTVDDTGNLYITAGDGFGGVVTMKIDGHGRLRWRQQFDGASGAWDASDAISVDRFGNVCVAAIIAFTSFDRDFLTLKYDRAGNLLWAKTFAGRTLNDDLPAAIATDAHGAVVVVGTEASNGEQRAIVIKYDARGNELWRQHCVPTSSSGTGVVVGDDGSVFCSAYAGFFQDDWVIVKYGPAGNELWRVRSAASGPAHSLALNRGSLYIAAQGNGGPIKLDQNGHVLWQAVGSSGISRFTKLDFDQKGAVYMGGIDLGEEEGYFRVLKYDRRGRQRYATEFAGAFTWGQGFAVDRRGNSYITTGAFDAAGFRYDALVKLDPRGEREWQWSFRDGVPGLVYGNMIRVSVDRAGAVFVTGPDATVKLVERRRGDDDDGDDDDD